MRSKTSAVLKTVFVVYVPYLITLLIVYLLLTITFSVVRADRRRSGRSETHTKPTMSRAECEANTSLVN